MPDDLLKNVFAGAVAGSAAANEVKRQHEIDRKRAEEEKRQHRFEEGERAREQARATEEEIYRQEQQRRAQELQHQHETESVTTQFRQGFDTLQTLQKEQQESLNSIESALSKIQSEMRTLVMLSQASTESDPRYLMHGPTPSQMYSEYMTSNNAATPVSFYFPPCWSVFLEAQINQHKPEDPPSHCLYVVREPEVVPAIKEMLLGICKKDRVNCRVVPPFSIGKAADLAGVLTNLEQGDFIVFEDSFVPGSEAILREVLEPALRVFRLDVILDSGPNARSVGIHLCRFSASCITTCTTRRTNFLSSIFPREVIISGLYPVFQSALIGKVCIQHGANVTYNTARQFLSLSKRLGYNSAHFAELMCKGNEEWKLDLSSQDIPGEEWRRHFEKKYGCSDGDLKG